MPRDFVGVSHAKSYQTCLKDMKENVKVSRERVSSDALEASRYYVRLLCVYPVKTVQCTEV